MVEFEEWYDSMTEMDRMVILREVWDNIGKPLPAVDALTTGAVAESVTFIVDPRQNIDDVLPADRRWVISKGICLVAAYRNCPSGETKEVMQQFVDFMRAALADAAHPASEPKALTLTDIQLQRLYIDARSVHAFTDFEVKALALLADHGSEGK